MSKNKRNKTERLWIEYRAAMLAWEESNGVNSDWFEARQRFYKAEAALKAAGIDPDEES